MHVAASFCWSGPAAPAKADTVQSGYEPNEAAVLLNYVLGGIAFVAVALLVSAALI
jgi:hypothetical protein